jgi:hypothetical protein
MKITLTDIGLFARVQTELSAITDEQISALKPGDAVPENAQIVGEFSPTMKVLLAVSQSNAKAAYRLLVDFVMKNPEPGVEEILELHKSTTDLSKKTRFYKKLFWDEVATVFGEAQGAIYGYGPNFEVYKRPQ